jgi:hypothetical protein
MVHGPYSVPRGCLTLEIRYYDRPADEPRDGRLSLTLTRASSPEPIEFDVRRIVNAGFTGRDQKAVRAHIEELQAHGVSCPAETPVYYAKLAPLVTTASAIEVLGEATSGEAEFALLVGRDRVLVAAGSDHTDRELEKQTIEKSKLVCESVLSREVWDLADVREGWDDLVLRSHVTVKGARRLYQEGPVARLLPPDDLLARVRGRLAGDPAGTVIFSGTFEVLGGELLFGERFEVELRDERRGRALRCDYRVNPVAWLRV